MRGDELNEQRPSAKIDVGPWPPTNPMKAHYVVTLWLLRNSESGSDPEDVSELLEILGFEPDAMIDPADLER